MYVHWSKTHEDIDKINALIFCLTKQYIYIKYMAPFAYKICKFNFHVITVTLQLHTRKCCGTTIPHYSS